jgi:hypothetical protein
MHLVREIRTYVKITTCTADRLALWHRELLDLICVICYTIEAIKQLMCKHYSHNCEDQSLYWRALKGTFIPQECSAVSNIVYAVKLSNFVLMSNKLSLQESNV